jgi:hypothetical protein
MHASLAHVLQGGSTLEARVDAARLVESLLRSAAMPAARAVVESKSLVAEPMAEARGWQGP